MEPTNIRLQPSETALYDYHNAQMLHRQLRPEYPQPAGTLYLPGNGIYGGVKIPWKARGPGMVEMEGLLRGQGANLDQPHRSLQPKVTDPKIQFVNIYDPTLVVEPKPIVFSADNSPLNGSIYY